ncbi:hypothetical protein CCAND93_1280002 [Capnocytophaga canis]|uniref:Uncharacterized protein n=1 Tax=Capnocytophaga canis TaxID=1848903 RepID=A0A0B7IGF3_9FLAO|nr:hypothetical protein CCAND93_1280002 [Capnocytophaga canis]
MKLSEKKMEFEYFCPKKTKNQRIKMKQLIQTNFYGKPHCDKINFYYLESMLWIQREN